MNQKLDINPKFKQALQLMKDCQNNLFITGKAGTGKSTLLQYFCQKSKHKPVVLAPTGVAALNAKGQTIHSFFNFYIDITPEKAKKLKPKKPEVYKNLKTIIIDEVSMLRADLLDCIDAFLRSRGPVKNKTFGGVQMIFIGDLHQLPPVVSSKDKQAFFSLYETEFFFSSKAFENFQIKIIELEKVYRQKDQFFIDILNRIRVGLASPDDIQTLNERVLPEFKPKKGKMYIHLTGINKKADEINSEQLHSLPGKTYLSSAFISGDFGKEYFPTNQDLEFKPKAQVMMLTNDSKRRWVNGSIGVIQSISKKDEVQVLLQDTGHIVSVNQHTWEIYSFSFSQEKKVIESNLTGSFIQYPFKLAWAVTIHKSQGKTFDRVVIDTSRGIFAAGQAYVALSRCTSLEGMVLKSPVKKHHIRTDWRVVHFFNAREYKKAHQKISITDKTNLINKAILLNKSLEITYLKGTGEKSHRKVTPISAGVELYKKVQYEGMTAFCHKAKDKRNFRIDRILDIKTVK